MSKILTIYTPYLTRLGEVWNVIGEYKFWFMKCLINRSAVWNNMLYWIMLYWHLHSIWIQSRFWSFGVSLAHPIILQPHLQYVPPNLPPIFMWFIVHLPSIHVQCSDAIIAPSRVLISLAPTHSTSTFPFLFLDLLWSPTTFHILVLKSNINTIPFPWLSHNSVKFRISSKIEALSCLACNPFFSHLLWVYYHNYQPLSIYLYLDQ